MSVEVRRKVMRMEYEREMRFGIGRHFPTRREADQPTTAVDEEAD